MTQPELVVHSSLTVTIANYLKPLLAAHNYSDVYVDRQIPETRPEQMVILSNNGGFDLNVAMAQTTMTINVWAGSDTDADNLSQLVAGLMKNAIYTDPIQNVTVVTYPTDVIDATGSIQRFMRFQITHLPIYS